MTKNNLRKRGFILTQGSSAVVLNLSQCVLNCNTLIHFLMLWCPSTVKLFLQLLHNSGCAAVVSHNVDICCAGFLMWIILNPHVENHCHQGTQFILAGSTAAGVGNWLRTSFSSHWKLRKTTGSRGYKPSEPALVTQFLQKSSTS